MGDVNFETLGEVTVPSGTVVLVDTGLLGFADQIEPPAIEVPHLPTVAKMPVIGTRVGDGELSHSWRHVDLVVQPGVTVHQRDEVGSVVVDFARLMFVDKQSLEHWKHTESLDGKADLVFWGRDAKKLAEAIEAPWHEEESCFGWYGIELDEAMERGQVVEERREQQGWTLESDFRPHSHHYQILKQICSTPTESGTLEVAGATLCAFHTTWGEGLFPVEVHLDAGRAVVRVRVVFFDQGEG
jgi:hypothetical protein